MHGKLAVLLILSLITGSLLSSPVNANSDIPDDWKQIVSESNLIRLESYEETRDRAWSQIEPFSWKHTPEVWKEYDLHLNVWYLNHDAFKDFMYASPLPFEPGTLPGRYFCRFFIIGKLSPPITEIPFDAYDWYECEILKLNNSELWLQKKTGGLRRRVRLFADGESQMVFLGLSSLASYSDRNSTVTLGTPSPDAYCFSGSDEVGFFHQVGKDHYRMSFTRPDCYRPLRLLELIPLR